IPEAIRFRLSLLRAPIEGAKWVGPEDMHITLRFAGDLDGPTADEFAGLLAEADVPPFTVSIAGGGAFGGRDPRVLWAGVEAGPELGALYRANERAARAVGLGPDRDFRPHVTLARLRRARQTHVARFLAENGHLRMEPFLVTRLVLLSARPRSGRPPYAGEDAYELRSD